MIHSAINKLAVDIDSLVPHPRNVREGDVGAISESLKHNGQYRPIVVQKSTNHILAGNHTWKAAKALGWDKIAVTYVDVDDERSLRILLADNKTNDLASYDENQLAELLQELAGSEESLSGTNFDGDDLDDLLFKLQGTAGMVADGFSITDLTDKYLQNEIKNLSLPYEKEQIEEIKKRLTQLMDLMQVESFSEVVWQLVENRYEDH
jgi:hypothetical protein